MNLSHLTIRLRLMVLLALFLAGFLVCGVWSMRTLAHLKVNGPLYLHIVQGKDLVADILPPPEYVLEPYLLCFQLAASAEPGRQARLTEQLAALRKAYDERHAYWEQARLEPELGEALLRHSHASALAFFDAIGNDFLPVLRRGDAEATRQSLERLGQLYDVHRQAIDRTVALANQRNARDEDQAAQVIERDTRLLLLISVLSVLACLGLSVLIIRSITGPLRGAIRASERMAEGDLGATIELRGRDELSQLQQALRSMQSSLLRTVSRVRRNAHQVAQASTEIEAGNLDLSERTERQASALQQTVATMTQLDEVVRQNAHSAQQANGLARSAREVALRGSAVVGEVVNTMKEINESSRQIADIVGTIDGIAFQTNILALNAAVEAARAGEQGRGFAVVAGEVRRLAQRSAESAREVRALIGASVSRVDAGSRLVDTARLTMDEVVQEIAHVSEIVGAISQANAEQSEGVSQVVAAVGQIDQLTQQNAALVEESAAATGSLRQQAQDMLDGVSFFRLPPAEPRTGLLEDLAPPRLNWHGA